MIPAALAERLFSALDRHDHLTMSTCYGDDAIFHDIAFRLCGRDQIHAMWHMICLGDIRVTYHIVAADSREVRVHWTAEYTFSETQRRVRNVTDTRLIIDGGSITTHVDDCNPRLWAAMALGGLKGFFAGRIGWLRRRKARALLQAFGASHSEYQAALNS